MTVSQVLNKEIPRGGAIAVEDHCSWGILQFETRTSEETPAQISILPTAAGESSVEEADLLEDLAAEGDVGRHRKGVKGVVYRTLLAVGTSSSSVPLRGSFPRVGDDRASDAPDTFFVEGSYQFLQPSRTYHTVRVGKGQDLSLAGLDSSVAGPRHTPTPLVQILHRITFHDLGGPITGAIIHHQDLSSLRRIIHPQERNQTLVDGLLLVQNRDYHGYERQPTHAWLASTSQR
jgi:hypothetical protein